MKWLDDVLASVPADYDIKAEEPPDDDASVGALPEDLVPIIRAWAYTQDKIQEARRSGISRGYTSLAEHFAGKPVDRQASLAELEALVRRVEGLERQEAALAALISAALWQQFDQSADEALGVKFTKDGWVVFRTPDDRPETSLLSLAFPMR